MKNLILLLLCLLLSMRPCGAQNDNSAESGKNESLVYSVKEISEQEYLRRKKASEHWRHAPYEVIKDAAIAEKMLEGKVRCIPDEYAEDSGLVEIGSLEITFNDGVKRNLPYGGISFADYFYEYYPELDIVVIYGEAGGDEPIDLNDSTNKWKVGNPRLHATSPEGMFRITGYSPGGAVDGFYWFMEKWNADKHKFENIHSFYEDNYWKTHNLNTRIELAAFHDWFWSDDNTLNATGYGDRYCEVRIKR